MCRFNGRVKLDNLSSYNIDPPLQAPFRSSQQSLLSFGAAKSANSAANEGKQLRTSN